MLIYTHEFPPFAGGAGVYSYDLAAGLSSQGVEVHVATPFVERPENWSNTLPLDIQLHYMERWQVAYPHAQLFLVRLHLKWAFDLVVVTERGAQEVLATMEFPCFRYVAVLHGTEVLAHIGGRGRNQAVAPSRMARFYERADACIAVSQATLRLARRLLAGRSVSLFAVHNGIDPARLAVPASDEVQRVRERYGEDAELVFCLGRLDLDKGQDVLIKAFREVRRERPNARLLLGGEGPTRPGLIQIRDSLGLSDCVEFLGEVLQRHLPLYFCACDVFALTSKCETRWEGFGLVYLEAGFYGRPTIGGNEGGVPEAIAHNESGLVVDPRDENAISVALVELLADRRLRERMGEAGRRRVLEYFNARRMAGDTLQVIQRNAQRSSVLNEVAARVGFVWWTLGWLISTLANRMSRALPMKRGARRVSLRRWGPLLAKGGKGLARRVAQTGEDRLISMARWMESACHRRRLEACLGEIVHSGMAVLDIGSGHGTALAILGRQVGDTGQVHAFEPDPEHFRTLQRRFPVDEFPQIRLNALALLHRRDAQVVLPSPSPPCVSAALRHVRLLVARWTVTRLPVVHRTFVLLRRRLRLLASSRHGVGPRPTHQAYPSPSGTWAVSNSVSTTDDYVAGNVPRLDALHVDVGGCEVHVLLGAFEAIRQHRPVLVFRIQEGAIRRAGFCAHFILQWLKSLGYEPAAHPQNRWPTFEAIERDAEAEFEWPLLVAFTPNLRGSASYLGATTDNAGITLAGTMSAGNPSSPASADEAAPPPMTGHDVSEPTHREAAESATSLRFLVAYDAGNAFATYEDREAKMERFLESIQMAGFAVEGFPMRLPGSRSWLPWAELERCWVAHDPSLLRMYEELAEKLDDYDVLLNSGGTNLHPDFLSELPCSKVAYFADDPEASEMQSRPLAPAYDLVFVANPGCMDMYRGWGVTNAFFLPLGVMRSESDPALTENAILTSERPSPVVFLASRDRHRDVIVEQLRSAFPEAVVRGKGWPQGTVLPAEAVSLYKAARIGWSFDQSVGPVTRRTFIVPANGALLLGHNRTFLSQLFVDGVEAVGFDTVGTCQ